jgi:hypothetical protein
MSNTITVFIEEDQIVALKTNEYSLYLAKKVNDSFTVIWIANPPFATGTDQAYQYENEYDISIPSYMVNFMTGQLDVGDVTITSGGKSCAIDLGQITTLQNTGVFTSTVNGGTVEALTIQNEMTGNPHAIVLDSQGNNIWINTASGLNIGASAMTPQLDYQFWFGPFQEAGTIIPSTISSSTVVILTEGDDASITFTDAGTWENGEPTEKLSSGQVREMETRVNAKLTK